MPQDYYSLITNQGLIKEAASNEPGGTTIDLTELAVGDSGGSYYDPDGSETALINEVYRVSLTHVVVDENNPNQLIAEGVLDETIGPFYIREVGIFDSNGDLFAIGKYPETFKPNLPSGSGKRLYIRMILGFANAPNVNLVINNDVSLDPNFGTDVNNALAERLIKTNNLSDLNNVSTARNNLGLGSAAIANNSSISEKGISYLPKKIIISNNGSDASHDIDFSSGVMQFNDGSSQALAIALTKRIDASWSLGNGNGGLFNGTVTVNTWYYCFAIWNPSTLAYDAGFDNNINASNIPSGYTKYQYLGAIRIDGSGNILGFKQAGNYFALNNTILDVNTTTTTSRSFYTLSVPPINLIAKINATLQKTSGSGGTAGWLTSPLEDDKVPNYQNTGSSSASYNISCIWTGYIEVGHLRDEFLTNNSTLGFRASDTGARIQIYTHGWFDNNL